jgi:hypothetical protein
VCVCMYILRVVDEHTVSECENDSTSNLTSSKVDAPSQKPCQIPSWPCRTFDPGVLPKMFQPTIHPLSKKRRSNRAEKGDEKGTLYP